MSPQKGTKVGTVDVSYTGEATPTVRVCFNGIDGNTATSLKVWVGATLLPISGGFYVTAPGQWPWKWDDINAPFSLANFWPRCHWLHARC
jgi:hypothetical protein